MKMKEMQPRLQLTSEEFADTWCTLIEAFYERGTDAPITVELLHLDDEKLIAYASELGTVLLFAATEIWSSRKRVAQDIRNKSSAAIVERFYARLYSDPQTAGAGRGVYEARRELFGRLSGNLGGSDPQKRQMELIGFARYLIAQVSDQPERRNTAAIERLSILLLEAAGTFLRFAENSFPDAGFGKTRFIVQK